MTPQSSNLNSPMNRDQHDEQRLSYLANLISHLSDALISTDMEFNILEWNAAAENMYGWSAYEVIGHPLDEFIHSDYEAATTRDDAFKSLLEHGEWKGDVTQKRKDGTVIPILASVSLIRAENGKAIGFVAINRDITERKRAEEKLLASEIQYRRLFEAAKDGILILDAETGCIVDVNPFLMSLLGYSKETFLGKEIWELAFLKDIAANQADLLEIQQREHIRHEDLSLETMSGHQIHVEFISNIYEVDHRKVIQCNIRDITERKQSVEALHVENERFQRFVGSNIVGIVIADAKGKVITANNYYLNILGVTRKDFEDGKVDWIKFTPREWLAADEKAIRELKERGICEPYEKEYVRADGTRRSVYIADSMLPGPDEQIAAFVLDITDRKQAERTLVESEASLKKSQAVAHVGHWTWDVGKNLVYWSDEMKRIFGIVPEDFDGNLDLVIQNAIHPDDRQRVLDMNEAVIQHGQSQSTEYRILRQDGSIRWIWAEPGERVKDETEKVIQLSGIVQDITDRKQVEEQVRQHLKHINALRAIDTAITSSFNLSVVLDIVLEEVLLQLNVDASAILLLDPQEQTIEYASSRGFHSNALQHTQLQVSEGYAGRAVSERQTIHISDLPATGGKLAVAMQLAKEDFVDYYGAPLIAKGEVKGVMEIYHRSSLHPDTEWLNFLDTLARQAAIAIDNAQLFDKLQRSNVELEQRVAMRTEELKQTNLELEHASRAKDEFLATMSHELRTPLNSILGLSELLLEQRRDPLSEHQQRFLQTIQSSGSHLLELINDILDLSKIEAGKFDYYPEAIGVDEICRASLAFVTESAAKKSIALAYSPETAVSRIYVDPRRLKQILVNLLTNAVKFTPEHGQVSLEVRADRAHDRIQFSVVDTGIGIAADDLKKLFQPFVQVNSKLTREHEGTGLGLALIQRLTDRQGGSVNVESEPGKGSRFTIHLPMGQAVLAQQDESETQGKLPIDRKVEKAEAPIRQVVILLAEDNMANVLTIGDYLEGHGYQIFVAHHGLEAVVMAGEHRPDIILMDVQMPVMDGLEAIRRLRIDTRFADTPIIALTALAMPGDRERCMEAGANEYMSKPVSLKALNRKIQELTQTVFNR